MKDGEREQNVCLIRRGAHRMDSLRMLEIVSGKLPSNALTYRSLSTREVRRTSNGDMKKNRDKKKNKIVTQIVSTPQNRTRY